MLTQETKRKIDSARDILVGKVPDPKAQIDQITTALIYKFMDDMDKDAMELGGKARFFTNGFEKYAWSKILDPKLGGHDRLELYAEAITKLWQNNHLPQLFRDIFKDAFLPYRNPETLSLFLKEINGFTYNHSEDLGDAFEYLLSIMSSQGDAGQFRTPRHIIDFIAEVVDPKKDESILDPACGTAGFLISAYKHILKQHDGKDDPERKEKPLTPDDKKKLMNNLVGYDISPDMVKLSKVNMYLHGFAEPKIYEYDTLSSDEKWDEMYDVIMANPPFMSPKGGIRPHKRFSVQANRAEVLFVDYIKEHLRPNGRAGVIVPEGIIFQSGKAYKQLRKILVEDGLFAVVSLPGGVFNPYAGVKTSILFFDNVLAKKVKHILFVKIHNDGFDLGAQRRPVIYNDLPLATEAIRKYQKHIRENGHLSISGWPDGGGENIDTYPNLQFVSKEEILTSRDIGLTGERYREIKIEKNQKWPMVELGEVCDIKKGSVITKKQAIEGDIPVIAGGQQPAYYHNSANRVAPIITISASGAYAGFVNLFTKPIFASDCSTVQPKNKDFVNILFIYYLLKSKQDTIYQLQQGGSQPHVYPKDIVKIKIPLPPLEVQKEIVEQIQVKQNAIKAAKKLIGNLEKEKENFGRSLRKLEGVEWVELGEIADLVGGGTPSKTNLSYWSNGTVKWISARHIDGNNKIVGHDSITDQAVKNSATSVIPKGSIIVVTRVSVGKMTLVNDNYAINQDLTGIIVRDDRVNVSFLFQYMRTQSANIISKAQGLGVKGVTRKDFAQTKVPLPSLEVQKQLVREAEKEEEIIEVNKRLIEIMEGKISKVLKDI